MLNSKKFFMSQVLLLLLALIAVSHGQEVKGQVPVPGFNSTTNAVAASTSSPTAPAAAPPRRTNTSAAAAVVTVSSEESDEIDSDEQEIRIDSFIYREPGCPMVAERFNLEMKEFEGDWKLTYGSMNWLTDMTKALLRRDPTVSEIKTLCPSVVIRSLIKTKSPTVLYYASKYEENEPSVEIDWKCSKKNIEFSIRCWPQRTWTKSKLECFFPTINLHTFVMIAATDIKNWILLVRCKIGVNENRPGEGMSWIVLSKTEYLPQGTMDVIFGLLDGYGFDVESFKYKYNYDSCPSPGNASRTGIFDIMTTTSTTETPLGL